jgi:ribosome-binding protein aMBF1 (putative translation factor)
MSATAPVFMTNDFYTRKLFMAAITILQKMKINGKQCVAIEEAEYRRLSRLAKKASGFAKTAPLPSLPPADAKGNRPALEYIQVSIARDIVKERRDLGLSQEQLAALAGLRQETVSRIESGKHSPTVRTVDKIERALKQAKAAARRRAR